MQPDPSALAFDLDADADQRRAGAARAEFPGAVDDEAIGNALGLSHTVTAGIVSAKHRAEVRPDGRLRYADFLQMVTDLRASPTANATTVVNVFVDVVTEKVTRIAINRPRR